MKLDSIMEASEESVRKGGRGLEKTLARGVYEKRKCYWDADTEFSQSAV